MHRKKTKRGRGKRFELSGRKKVSEVCSKNEDQRKDPSGIKKRNRDCSLRGEGEIVHHKRLVDYKHKKKATEHRSTDGEESMLKRRKRRFEPLEGSSKGGNLLRGNSGKGRKGKVGSLEKGKKRRNRRWKGGTGKL